MLNIIPLLIINPLNCKVSFHQFNRYLSNKVLVAVLKNRLAMKPVRQRMLWI